MCSSFRRFSNWVSIVVYSCVFVLADVLIVSSFFLQVWGKYFSIFVFVVVFFRCCVFFLLQVLGKYVCYVFVFVVVCVLGYLVFVVLDLSSYRAVATFQPNGPSSGWH